MLIRQWRAVAVADGTHAIAYCEEKTCIFRNVSRLTRERYCIYDIMCKRHRACEPNVANGFSKNNITKPSREGKKKSQNVIPGTAAFLYYYNFFFN